MLKSALLSVAALVLTAGVAFAQSTGGGPGTGTGPGAGPSTGPGVVPGSDGVADLPRVPDPKTPGRSLAPGTDQPEIGDGYEPSGLDVEPPPPPEPPPEPEGEMDPEPPPELYGEPLESENDTIFYVIDQSGSMGWDRQQYVNNEGQTTWGDRLDRAKSELRGSISALSENFRFNMIAYDCGRQMWRNGLQQATMPNKQAGIGWVMALRDMGATGTGPAMAQALRTPEIKLCVLLTDGDPNCGANGMGGHRNMIRNANTNNCTINCFGIAAYGQFRSFLQQVASDGHGSYFDVP